MSPLGISLLVCLTAVLGCADQTNERPREQLRVGATWGLTNFTVGSDDSGSSASAVHLLVDPIDAHIDSTRHDGRTVRMYQRPDSRIPVDTLAKSFQYESLVSTTVADDETIVALFSDEVSAARVASLSTYGGFALGPFELRDFNNGRATLVRKSDHPIKEILIEEVSASDEWRRFLGGSLDVIPMASFLHRERLVGVPSIKIVDYPPQHSMGLLFNTAKATLKDPRTRRQLSALLDRAALARVLLGSESQALARVVADDDIPPTLTARPLLLAFVESDTEFQRTAAVIRYQLAEYDIDVELVPLDTDGLVQFCRKGLFDMALLPIPTSVRGYDRFLSIEHPESANITGYANPVYDQAYNAKQTDVMDRILRLDTPVTLLYTEQFFAAIRADLCLGEEPILGSWRWLAALYPCYEGPRR